MVKQQQPKLLFCDISTIGQKIHHQEKEKQASKFITKLASRLSSCTITSEKYRLQKWHTLTVTCA
jgi:hypothetical protein